jgi:hypothetical protein
MLPVKNTEELLQSITVENLYAQLIAQLNKDFQLVNVTSSFESTNSPTELKKELFAILLHLINNQYDDYLNLLYRIDVPESELAKLKNDNLTTSMEEITYLVLKREYQKVWFKNKL